MEFAWGSPRILGSVLIFPGSTGILPSGIGRMVLSGFLQVAEYDWEEW